MVVSADLGDTATKLTGESESRSCTKNGKRTRNLRAGRLLGEGHGVGIDGASGNREIKGEGVSRDWAAVSGSSRSRYTVDQGPHSVTGEQAADGEGGVIIYCRSNRAGYGRAVLLESVGTGTLHSHIKGKLHASRVGSRKSDGMSEEKRIFINAHNSARVATDEVEIAICLIANGAAQASGSIVGKQIGEGARSAAAAIADEGVLGLGTGTESKD